MTKEQLVVHSILLIITCSCKMNYSIIGTWEEAKYKRESLTFTKNNEMVINEDNGPLRFKYKVNCRDSSILLFEVQIYDDTNFVETINHKMVFHTRDSVTIRNMDDKNVNSNTYIRK